MTMHMGRYQIWVSEARDQFSLFMPRNMTPAQHKPLITEYGEAEDGSQDRPMQLLLTFWSPSWGCSQLVYRLVQWWVRL